VQIKASREFEESHDGRPLDVARRGLFHCSAEFVLVDIQSLLARKIGFLVDEMIDQRVL
jgi:hypothetical protein